MLPRERFDAALEMREVDRFPLFYQHFGAAKWVTGRVGRTMKEGFHDPEVFADLAMGAYQLYDFDNVMAGWGDILVEAQAHGMQWKFPERDFYPRADKYVPLAEVDKIRPVDPLEDKFWSVPLRAGAIMQHKIGQQVAVVGGVVAPFMVAAELVGFEPLMMALLSSPDVIDDLLPVLLESDRMYADALARSGIGDIFIEDGSAGMEQNSPELCERYDQKYLGALVDHCRKLGLRTIIHNCSASPYLEMNAHHCPHAIHFASGSVDLPAVFRQFKGKTCVMAGPDQAIFLKMAPEEMEKSVRLLCELWGKEAGFMLAPDEMPYKSPLENIQRFRECADKFGTLRTCAP
jgi:uroporphyrinogen-III decarboxylase